MIILEDLGKLSSMIVDSLLPHDSVSRTVDTLSAALTQPY